MQTGRVVLASGSSARAALLRNAGVIIEIKVTGIDEAAVKTDLRGRGAGPEDVALALAELKARAVTDAGAVVIGADQILVCEGVWFDKPVSLAAAADHLRALRGKAHGLVTAVTARRDGIELWRHVARQRLMMRRFSDAFLDAYLAAEGENLLQSVGAYRLEGPGAQLFERVEGEHSAVLGLPMLPLLDFMRQAGILLA